ncbi:MAG: helicase-associated domain-containing protein [Bacillota bacterium]
MELKQERQTLASQIAGLSPDELLALRIIAFSRRGRGIAVERCHQKLNEISKKWRRNAGRIVEGLLASQLVRITRLNYRHVYQVPEELLPQVVRLLYPEMLARMNATVPESERHQDTSLPMEAYEFMGQLHLMMSLLHKRPARLTSGGSVRKTQLKQIVQKLGLFPEQEHSTARLEFLLQLARDLGFLKEETEANCVQPSAKWFEWLQLTPLEKVRSLMEYSLESLVEPDPDLETALGLLYHAGDRFVRVDRLVDEVSTLGPGSSWQSLKARLDKQLEVLACIGAVQKLATFEGLCCRLSQFGAWVFFNGPSPKDVPFQPWCYVQPNFQVLAPCDAPPNLLWEISAFCELVKFDVCLTFSLTRESIYQALACGKRLQDFLKLLRNHCKAPLPQNVEFTVSRWASEYGSLYFMRPLLLHCQTPTTAAQIANSPRLAPYVLGMLSPCDIVLDPDCVEEFREKLKEEGYMPSPGLLDRPAQSSSDTV